MKEGERVDVHRWGFSQLKCGVDVVFFFVYVIFRRFSACPIRVRWWEDVPKEQFSSSVVYSRDPACYEAMTIGYAAVPDAATAAVTGLQNCIGGEYVARTDTVRPALAPLPPRPRRPLVLADEVLCLLAGGSMSLHNCLLRGKSL